MIETVLIVLAGLMGAAGIGLAAAGAHAAPGAGLDNAGNILLFHAAALLAGTAALHAGLMSRPVGLIALFGLLLGAVLFSGDIALRALAGQRLFPMAAPTGGMVLIAGWLLIAIAALAKLLRWT